MISLQLDILNERALDVIRYLEKVQDVRIIQAEKSASSGPSSLIETPDLKPDGPIPIETSSPTNVKTDPSQRTHRKYFKALAQPGDTSAMEQHFDKIREEWADRI